MIAAITNAAGSAGKTTTAVTLAVLLAAQGARVLVVDADAQANATDWLGVRDAEVTLSEVLRQEQPLSAAITDTNTDGVQLVPANRSLEATALLLNAERAGEQRLRKALRDVEFDVVLIDCPGNVSTLTLSALVAAEKVISVTMPSRKEIDGLPELEDVVADVADAYRPGLVLNAVVLCNVPPANAGVLHVDAVRLLRDNYGELVSPAVRKSVRVPEAYGQSVPLPVHAPREAVTADYEAVLVWLQGRGVLTWRA